MINTLPPSTSTRPRMDATADMAESEHELVSTPAPVHRHNPENLTRDRILDAADEILADRGFEGLSLRTVTARAGVNLASVHYYFGSKDGLVFELVRRRFGPINARRLDLLDAAIARSLPGGPSLDDVVDAYIEPLLQFESPAINPRAHIDRRVLGRILSLPPGLAEPVFRETFAVLARRFHDALSRALPHLSAEEIFWRMHLAIGPVTHVLTQAHILPDLSGGLCSLAEPVAVRTRVRDFICAGFRAPVLLA